MSSPSQILIFDRLQVRRQRERAAPLMARHSAVLDEAADQLLERLRDVKRNFTQTLDLGAHHGVMTSRLRGHGVPFVVATDLAARQARQIAGPVAVVDEEFLPFGPRSFDLVVSNLSLHWVNDLPGALVQLRQTLRPDGLFLAVILGGNSLHELRDCLTQAELVVTGGVSPRVSPMVDLLSASALLQRAGFQLPVTDMESLTLIYPDMLALLHDLRGMGEGNAQLQRLKHPTRRRVLLEAARLYQQNYASDGGVAATFELVFLHGWQGQS